MNKRRKYRITRPNKLLYIILGGIVSLFTIVIKKQKIISTLPKNLKGPFIVVGNHTSFYDFVYMIRALYPRRINFVVARKYFHFHFFNLVMKISHAIPKSLYQPDLSTVTSMYDVLKQDGIIGVYPEGQIGIHGVTIENGESIAKFVKKVEVTVVRVLTGGAYFVDTPWSKCNRKGKIESNVDIVLTIDQIKELSVKEISEIIQESIYRDNFEWQSTTGNKYIGKNLASGLENLLYVCPKCDEEYTINTNGDYIICENCGSSAKFCTDGHLLWKDKRYFNHIGEWNEFQIKHEEKMIKEDFELSEKVELAMIKESGVGIEVIGEGEFIVSRYEYTYQGTIRDEVVKFKFSTNRIKYIPIDAGMNFQIYDRNKLYEFRPENPKWCAKISTICEAMSMNNIKEIKNI